MSSSWVPLKNGGKAIPMRLDFLLTPDDLARILAYWQKESWLDNDEALPTLTKAAATNEIKNMLRYAGWESFYFWSDDVPDDAVEIIWSWAQEQVRKVYPDA